jgi:hypothetical protein
MPTAPKNITMVMEQCNSGGFVDNFVTNYVGSQNRTIATAANGSEPSYGNGFSNAWTSAMANIQTGYPLVADTDKNQKISAREAFDFALLTDPSAISGQEHPQYSDKQTDAGKTWYLSSCPGSSIVVQYPNGPGEVWYMGYKRNITWTQTGLSGKNVDIELWKGAAATRTQLIATVPASSGFYRWTNIQSPTADTDYYIKISNYTSQAVSDRSDNNFEIKANATGLYQGKYHTNSRSHGLS